VVVTLPPRAGRTAGMALLMDHAEWVSERLAALPGAVAFADGARVPLHGVEHRIRHMPDARGGVWVEQGEIRVSGEAAFLARRVADFFRAEARRRLATMATEKAARLGLTPSRVTVKDTRSRWGSCAANGRIAFCWRLAMAPPEVQDYVAAHEVAHLRHMNHGPRFWTLVEQLTPWRERAVAWLHTHGPRLLRVG
jgi:predicted metal-dependent hydrolase